MVLQVNGVIIWITGLSAAGKTTVGEELASRLRVLREPVVFLDGDSLRDILGEFSTHTREDRLRLAFVYSRLCKSLASQNINVVISTVALFREIHVWNREHFKYFLEVFLDVPLDELRRRDPKSIYKRFDEGEITNVAGLDLKVDFPASPHLHIQHQDGLTSHQIVETILDRLSETNFNHGKDMSL
jgi:adenylylsulfate kinase-like enzyme